MRLDLTRAGIWPRRGGRDRKTWRDLKRDYVVQLLLQRTIVELDQASGRSEGTEGETRKVRHEMLNKEIESLAGLGFQDLKDSSIKTWRKDTSVET
jgi:hypothetical protein